MMRASCAPGSGRPALRWLWWLAAMVVAAQPAPADEPPADGAPAAFASAADGTDAVPGDGAASDAPDDAEPRAADLPPAEPPLFRFGLNVTATYDRRTIEFGQGNSKKETYRRLAKFRSQVREPGLTGFAEVARQRLSLSYSGSLGVQMGEQRSPSNPTSTASGSCISGGTFRCACL